MSALMTQMERWLNPVIAGIFAAVGAVLGGLVYISFSGALAGAVLSLGLACAVISVLSVIGALSGAEARPAYAAPAAPVGPVATPSPAPAAPPLAPAAVASAATTAGTATIESTLPSAAKVEPVKIEATESEAQLMNAGRFAEYHLAKAKRFYAERNFKEAAYQAGASLSHGDLPEAAQVRKSALAAA